MTTSYGVTHPQRLAEKTRINTDHGGEVHPKSHRCYNDLTDKPRYNIRNLVTNKEYVADVTHIRHFYYDLADVTLLNIAVKETDETW